MSEITEEQEARPLWGAKERACCAIFLPLAVLTAVSLVINAQRKNDRDGLDAVLSIVTHALANYHKSQGRYPQLADNMTAAQQNHHVLKQLSDGGVDFPNSRGAPRRFPQALELEAGMWFLGDSDGDASPGTPLVDHQGQPLPGVEILDPWGEPLHYALRNDRLEVFSSNDSR